MAPAKSKKTTAASKKVNKPTRKKANIGLTRGGTRVEHIQVHIQPEVESTAPVTVDPIAHDNRDAGRMGAGKTTGVMFELEEVTVIKGESTIIQRGSNESPSVLQRSWKRSASRPQNCKSRSMPWLIIQTAGGKIRLRT
jgi:hypothetical protein